MDRDFSETHRVLSKIRERREEEKIYHTVQRNFMQKHDDMHRRTGIPVKGSKFPSHA